MGVTDKKNELLDERLYSGPASAVYRGRYNGQKAIVKRLSPDLCTPRGLARFRFEYDIASQLKGEWFARPLAFIEVEGSPLQIYEDIGAAPVAARIGTLSIDDSLRIAIHATAAIAEIHKANVIHKDISPANLVVTADLGRLQVIDFGISTRLDRETQAVDTLKRLEDTIDYMSPEQTGRMNRSIDFRSDFFSLGATLYHLLTGEVPFPGQDIVERVHLLLAAEPKSPRLHRPDIPAALAAVVLKLLAKSPEDRYQSAIGLRDDLERCWRQAQNLEPQMPFELGRSDRSSRFELPEKLYGRAAEVERLLATFTRVRDGAPELVQVSGPSGIGKSALVSELANPIVESRAYFVGGKFDQLQRNLPFSAITQALNRLVYLILSEDEGAIDEVRGEIRRRVGDQCHALIKMVPHLKDLLGEHAAPVALDPDGFHARFIQMIRGFIGAVATPTHPLVIFLDDVQWADSGSLDVLTSLLHPDGPRHVLVIAAYRDNEVGPEHLYTMTTSQIRRAGARITDLNVAPLGRDPIRQMVADTVHRPVAEAAELADVIFEKTGGNAFFARMFLLHLHEERLLRHDAEAQRWSWTLAEVTALPVTANVVELLLAKMQVLGPDAREALNLAACIGAEFNLSVLGAMLTKAPWDAMRVIWPSVKEGFVAPIDDEFKVFLANIDDEALRDRLDFGQAILKFSHDRIQQAAHQLLPKEKSRTAHWAIGQSLLASLSQEGRISRIFEIVDHLNYSLDAVGDGDKDRLGNLNAVAGNQAILAGAYSSGIAYFNNALQLVGPASWSSHYDIVTACHVGLARAYKATNRYEESIAAIQAVIKNVRTALERSVACEVLGGIYELQIRWDECIAVCIEGLKALGVKISVKVSDLRLGQALMAFRLFQMNSFIKDKSARRSSAGDARWETILALSNRASVAAFMANQNLFPMLYLQPLRLAKKERVHLESPIVAIALAMLGGVLRNKKAAIELRKIAYAQRERTPHFARSDVFQITDSRWVQPLTGATYEACVETCAAGFKSAVSSGDLGFAGCPAFLTMLNACHGGFRFPDLVELGDRYRPFFLKVNPDNYYFGQFFAVAQTIRALAGLTDRPDSMSDAAVNQDVIERKCNSTAGGSSIYKTMSAWLAFSNGDYRSAFRFQIKNFVHKLLPGCLTAGLGATVIALSVLRSELAGAPVVKSKILSRLIVGICRLDLSWWSSNQHWGAGLKDLVDAEALRLRGKVSLSLRSYEKALARFNDSKSYFWVVMAHEALGRYYRDLGLSLPAVSHMTEAIDKAEKFGMAPKARALADEFSKYLDMTSRSSADAAPGETAANADLTLDMASIIKATQSISGQIDSERLVTDILHISMQNAGANYGALVVRDGTTLTIKAVGELQSAEFSGRIVDTPINDDTGALVPRRLIALVYRTKEELILNQVTEDASLKSDPYVERHGSKSFMCMPILHQGEIAAVLFLDNRLLENAFTADRVATLRILGAQGAISLKNAESIDEIRDGSAKISALNGQLEKILAGTRDMASSHTNEAAIGFALETMADEIDQFKDARCSVLLPAVGLGPTVIWPRDPTANDQGARVNGAGHDWASYLNRTGLTVVDDRTVVIPIRWHDSSIGLLILEELTNPVLSPDDIRFIGTLTQSLGLSLKNIEHSENLEALVAQRTQELNLALLALREKQQKIQAILDNIDQGIVTFDQSFLIEPEFSRFVTEIFQTPAADVANRSILALLLANAKASDDVLQMIEQSLFVIIGEDEMNWILNSSRLPTELTVNVFGNDKILALDWKPRVNDEIVTKMMLTIRDITAHRLLAEQVATQKADEARKMGVLGRMLAVDRSSLADYFRDTGDMLAKVRTYLGSPVNLNGAMLELHTVKGNSRILKFDDLVTLVHAAETGLQATGVAAAGDQAPLAELRAQFEQVAREFDYLAKLHDDVFAASGGAATKTWSLHSLASDLFPTVVALARGEGLGIERFEVRDKLPHWDDRLRARVATMLTHSINNAIDHGYLLPKKRGAKVADIEIEITAQAIGRDRLTIRVEDRGAGIDLTRVQALATKLGRTDLSGAGVVEVLFDVGASTAEVVTHTSGRGAGLGAIRQAARDLGGDVTIGNRDGGGTRLEILLPLAMGDEGAGEEIRDAG